MIQFVLDADGEQAVGLEEVNRAINHLDTLSQRNASVAGEATATCLTLTQEAGVLTDLVSRFSMKDDIGTGRNAA